MLGSLEPTVCEEGCRELGLWGGSHSQQTQWPLRGPVKLALGAWGKERNWNQLPPWCHWREWTPPLPPQPSSILWHPLPAERSMDRAGKAEGQSAGKQQLKNQHTPPLWLLSLYQLNTKLLSLIPHLQLSALPVKNLHDFAASPHCTPALLVWAPLSHLDHHNSLPRGFFHFLQSQLSTQKPSWLYYLARAAETNCYKLGMLKQ